jgi:hypothetical protein
MNPRRHGVNHLATFNGRAAKTAPRGSSRTCAARRRITPRSGVGEGPLILISRTSSAYARPLPEPLKRTEVVR